MAVRGLVGQELTQLLVLGCQGSVPLTPVVQGQTPSDQLQAEPGVVVAGFQKEPSPDLENWDKN